MSPPIGSGLPPPIPSVRVITGLLTLPVVVLGVGFIFHTDFEPDVFGKYKGGYFAFLLGWWLLLTPGVFFFLDCTDKP